MSDEFTKPLAAPRKPQLPSPENRVPGQIVEKLAKGVEYFDQYPPTEQKDFVLEVIRICAAQGLMFLTSEVAEERFKAADGKQYTRYIIDITIATRTGYIWGRTFRHSVTVLFAGIDTSYRAKKRVMRDFFSLLFGVELPPEPEVVHRAPPTGPACTGKESAARKFQLLEQNRKEMDWLWHADRGEVAATAEQRAKQLSSAAHRPQTVDETAT